MALADELENEIQASTVNRCKICRWFDSLAPEDAQAYTEWINSDRDLAKLHRAASRIDPPVPGAYSSFSRHVRECQ